MDAPGNVYMVPNEYPKKIQSCKEEMEMAAFLQHTNPDKAFNNAFSKFCLRNFKRAIADIYCMEDNAIWFFNECVIHGHDPRLCPITKGKKDKEVFQQNLPRT